MNTMISSGAPPLALIAGPTASGKSALALRLAEIANGVVINADASQVYADLRILSARPSAEEEGRAPHRLFGYLDAAASCSAADWAAAARTEIARAHDAGQLPIIVGGTGLYLRTLLDGIAPIPAIDPAVREQVRALNVAEAHEALASEDPVAAARLRPSDTTRVARALEVVRSTGRKLADWQQEKAGGIKGEVRLGAAVLLPPRPWLHARINARFAAMMETGGLAEAERLLARNLDLALPAVRAIGVREAAAHLRGEIDYSEMISRGQAATRQYAKRQYTWFNHQSPREWNRLEAPSHDTEIERNAIILQSASLT